MRIYFDHAATTPVDPRVVEAMTPYWTERFGNPGSLHSFGQEAIAALDSARERIAGLLGVGFRNIIFTGSATEANNLALRGTVAKWRETHRGIPKVIVSRIEHESVLETARDLGRSGAEVVYLDVDRAGRVDERALAAALDERTAVVSVMYANNETGAIVADIPRIADILRGYRGSQGEDRSYYPLLHSDAAQAFQFRDCRPERLGVHLLTLSAHKIYGPKGIGVLYAGAPALLAPVVTGGGQEFGLRSATENVPLAVGFAEAAVLADKLRVRETERIGGLRDHFWKGLKKIRPKAKLNGVDIEGGDRLPHILNIQFPGLSAEELLAKFDLAGLAVSAGSACAARSQEPSHVMAALGLLPEEARASLRVSFGRPTRRSHLDRALRIIQKLIPSE